MIRVAIQTPSGCAVLHGGLFVNKLPSSAGNA
jgi:hypothetical protein